MPTNTPDPVRHQHAIRVCSEGCRRIGYYEADEDWWPAGWYWQHPTEEWTSPFCPECGAALHKTPETACPKCLRSDLMGSITLDGTVLWRRCGACGWETGPRPTFEITMPGGLTPCERGIAP